MDINRKEIRRARLQKLMDERFDGKQAALADNVGVVPNLISRYIRGTKGIGEDMRIKIEDACGLPRGWLDLESSQGEESNVAPGPDRTGHVPLISWVQAGDWAHAADLLHPGDAYEWVDTGVAVRPHTFALRVQGDSMEPEFVAGTIVVVEPELDALPGDYVIAKNGEEEATFKQLVRDGSDLYLKPLNPRYPIKPLGNARVVGVVREAVKRYR